MREPKTINKILAIALALLLALPCFAVCAFAEGKIISVGKSYTVSSESPIENAFPGLADDEPDGRLTDGKNGGGKSYNDGKYVRCYRGTYKYVTIDLGAVCAVSGAQVSHYQNSAAGIYAIREIDVYVSVDGENYACIASDHNDNRIAASTKNGRVVVKAESDNTYKARYVKVRFSCDVFAYVDEVSVLGSTDASAAQEIAPDAPDKNVGFAGAVDGINHICLIYAGEYAYGSPTANGKSTAEQLLPYFAYVDKDGKPVDTMFEGILFLPYQPASKSDDTTSEFGFGKQSGWQSFIDTTIGAGEYNLSALNKVVGDNKEAVGLAADYQYPVYIAVPYIHPSTNEFDVGGETVKANTLENRQKIVKWYVDAVTKAFGDAKFDNLKLCGFYWYSEAVQYVNGENENDLIKYFTSYVDSIGKSSLWIPYYCSPGYQTANELGFTAAVLQSGYAFDHSSSETGDSLPATCDDAMQMADKYGLGAEIEVSSLDSSMYDRYYKYLQAAYAGGYMQDGLFMYYQGGGPGVYYSASKQSAAITQRKGYDITYQFIHGEFVSAAPVVAENQTLMIGKGGFVTCNIDVSDADSAASQLKVVGKIDCGDIIIAVEGDGYTVINAKNSDFVGETGFELTVTDGFNVSNTALITLKVVEECLTVDRINGKLKNNFTALYTYDPDDSATGTTDTAYEVVIDKDGVITAVGGFNGNVPEGGYIIAASGTKQQYLIDNCAVGGKAIVDAVTGCVLFEKAAGDETTSDIDTPSADKDPESDSNSVVVIVIIVIAALAVIAAIVLLISKKRKK